MGTLLDYWDERVMNDEDRVIFAMGACSNSNPNWQKLCLDLFGWPSKKTEELLQRLVATGHIQKSGDAD